MGWAAPRGDAHGALVESIAGQRILKFTVESKSVPANVVRRKADEEIARIEASTGRKPGKKETRDLREDAKRALLPQAFSKVSSVWVWLDAEQDLLDARAQRLTSEAQRYVGVYNLLSAMGLLSVEHLNLGVPVYDPATYYNAVKRAPISVQGKALDRIMGKVGN